MAAIADSRKEEASDMKRRIYYFVLRVIKKQPLHGTEKECLVIAVHKKGGPASLLAVMHP